MWKEKQSPDVLIINSPLFRDKMEGYDEDSLPPLGLGYIATDLLSNGITVELLDAVEANIPIDTLLAVIRQKRPHYVALNVFTTNLHLIREIMELIDGETRFIIGGLATKNLYKTILFWNISCPVDIVIGEGDFVVSAIVQEKPLDIISQYGNKRVIMVSTDSPYFPHDISNVPLDRSFFINQPLRHTSGFNEVSIITSRGCMYNCAFCSAARSLNREIPIRERNTRSVANEVMMLCELYRNIDSMRVLDDLFLRNVESVERAVHIFEHVPATWRAMAHVLSFYKLSDAQLLELKRSGCKEVFIGIESGSPRILRMIHKTSDVDLIKRTIQRLFCAGIDVKGYFIFGFESETFEDMQMSYDLVSWLKESSIKYGVNFRTSVFQFRPYHGTELYHDMILKGRIIDEVAYHKDLSEDIGRKQFNFTSGNFSEVSDEDLRKFITKTNGINR
ncbi:MAG: B12-binding domain-containing radical SAM protein [Bacteroidetes bacterium]|nr:MAG: B12-binding domain-containing radical SAM protein [Bacteroidota bacterium]